MSDDDDIIYVKKHKSIHYGSLEEQERARLAHNDDSNEAGASNSAENAQIHTSNGKIISENLFTYINNFLNILLQSIWSWRIICPKTNRPYLKNLNVEKKLDP